MNHRFTLGQRIRYRFDNFMAKGTKAQLIGLLVVSAALASIFAVMLVFVEADPELEQKSFFGVLWSTGTGVLKSGAPSWTPDRVVLMVVKGGLFLSSLLVGGMLIGIITSGFRERVKALAKGRSPVPVEGHTVILGWSSTITGVLAELAAANESVPDAHLVVLADGDKAAMDQKLADSLPASATTTIVTRAGDPLSAFDLDLVNLDDSRAVIVLPPDGGDDTDIEVIKRLMAVAGKPRNRVEPYEMVTSIRDPKNRKTALLAGRGQAQVIVSTEIVSKITAQTCRQRGLPAVYTELLSFRGNELYTHVEPSLVGRTFREAVGAFDTSAVLGLIDADREVRLNPAGDRALAAGEQLILIAKDDSLIRLDGKRGPLDEDAIVARPTEVPAAETALLLGWNRGGTTVIRELDAYVRSGSSATVVVPDEETLEVVRAATGGLSRLSVAGKVGDVTDWELLETLDVPSYDHVLLLSHDNLPADQSDARVMLTLIHVRNLTEAAGAAPSVVSELELEHNRAVAQAGRADDFVVGDHLVSLLYSQVAQNPIVCRVFLGLLSQEGCEIYLKPVSDYVQPEREIDFYTVVEAAARKGEVAIGYRRLADEADVDRSYGVVLNPVKSQRLRFAPEDRIIVVAEDYFGRAA